MGDVTNQVAACLPPREGRTKEQSEQAAEAVARGLLEFAVWDLEPAMFQRVLLARLDRLATDQASLFEEGLAELHADLYSEVVELLKADTGPVGRSRDEQEGIHELLELQEKLQQDQYRSVVARLGVLAERLPARPAGRGDLRVYLERLVAWLDEDIWPRRLGGPVLSPSVIERTLQVRETESAEGQRPADQVVDRCNRLVILGEPGAGKTWLAKRTARRCAQTALAGLDSGRDLDAIEMPLYMTCRDLLTHGGNINEASTAAAVDHMGYVGPLRRVEALRTFLANRETRMLVVVDSLDEAATLDQRRLRELDTVGWRVVLTSRPSSWTEQVTLDTTDDTHLEGRLEPLSYPEDINPFIERWFRHQPAQADQLIKQIEDRSDLQKTATVPLILAFYCIIGGHDPLPRFRRDLYDRLIKRLLTGYWRSPHNNELDVVDPEVLCRQLRDWAWQAARNHPHSRLGAWQDTFPTPSGTLAQPAREVLDHLATATGPRNVDTGTIPRRFIHRSIQEHLVAQHLADAALFPVAEVVDELLSHLWYDPDWEYAAPAAIAARDDRDELLRLLLYRAARTQTLPPDLSVIEAGSELHRFVGRLATETDETDWSPEIAQLIGQARLQLSQARELDLVGATAHWTTTNAAVRTYLLDQFGATYGGGADALVSCLVQLAEEPEDKARIRPALIDKLTTATHGSVIDTLVSGLVQLDPTPADNATARARLIELLTDTTDGWPAEALTSGLAQLGTEPDDKVQARATLIDKLTTSTDEGATNALVSELVRLDPTPHDKMKARATIVDKLTTAIDPSTTAAGALGLVQLDPTPPQKAQARATLIDKLTTSTGRTVEALVSGLVQLDPTPADKATARGRLMELLTDTTGGWAAEALVSLLVQLDPTPHDKTTARTKLLELLADAAGSWSVEALVSGLVRLNPTPQERTTAQAKLLGLLADPTNRLVAAEELAPTLVRLATQPDDKAQARAALVADLAHTASDGAATELMSWLARLDPTPHDLVASKEWAAVPSSELLQAARRNATVEEWLRGLPY